jgi:hypothetical protein
VYDNKDTTSLDTNNTRHMYIQESITRARVRQLNHQMSLFLRTFGNCENAMLPDSVIIVLRNNVENQKTFGERLRED